MRIDLWDRRRPAGRAIRRRPWLRLMCCVSISLVLGLFTPGWIGVAPARDFSDVLFVTPDVGWLMSTEDILQTTDGGQSWTVRIPYRSATAGIRFPQDLQVLDAQHAWVLYTNSRLVLTQDGGQTWQGLDVEPTVQQGNLTVKTNLRQFRMVTTERGFGVSSDGEIFLRTTDGGRTWRPQIVRTDPPGFDVVEFLDLQNGWLMGPLGLLARTSDGGQTWQPLPQSPIQNVLEARFQTRDTGWALEAAPNRLFRTTDGGQTWQRCAPGQTPPPIYGVHFRTPTLGWATADAGIILKSTDGCATWQIIQTPTSKLLVAVYFLDDLTGWAVGDDNTLLKTTDGGLTWTPVPVNVP